MGGNTVTITAEEYAALVTNQKSSKPPVDNSVSSFPKRWFDVVRSCPEFVKLFLPNSYSLPNMWYSSISTLELISNPETVDEVIKTSKLKFTDFGILLTDNRLEFVKWCQGNEPQLFADAGFNVTFDTSWSWCHHKYSSNPSDTSYIKLFKVMFTNAHSEIGKVSGATPPNNENKLFDQNILILLQECYGKEWFSGSVYVMQDGLWFISDSREICECVVDIANHQYKLNAPVEFFKHTASRPYRNVVAIGVPAIEHCMNAPLMQYKKEYQARQFGTFEFSPSTKRNPPF